jgi:pre-60S factor REI1
MKSDWHRYNLKRKVIELPPVTAEQFAQKITKHVEEQQITYCLNCKKSFASENSYKNHLNSKKHKELEQALEQASEASYKTSEAYSEVSYKNHSIDWRERLLTAQTESEIEQILVQKKQAAVRLTEYDCLFCNDKLDSFEMSYHLT